jgi:hypothetical protein
VKKLVTGWGFETFADTSILRRLVRGAGPPTDPRQSNAWVAADPDVHGNVYRAGHSHQP